MRRALDGVVATLLLVSVIGLALNQDAASAAAQPINSWTIMVYMAADNSVPLPWEGDINEMEAAQQDDQTKVIALLDTYDAPNSRLLRIVHDPNGLDSTIVSSELDDNGAIITGGEVNTGSPNTLRDFVLYCVSEFPAHRYVLILWGHGSGWHGLCPDGVDFLTMPELRLALAESTDSIGRPLDLVGVDACAQGSLEMICQLKGMTDVFVASEKDVPYEGLPYVQVLNSLADDVAQTPMEFGRNIADEYYLWSTINSMYSTTMAVFDMERIDPMRLSLSTLSSVGARYNSIFHSTMKSIAEDAEHYEDQWHVDLGDFLGGMGSGDLPLELREAALASLLAYSDLVSYSKLFSNPDPIDQIWANASTGAVIYFQGSGLLDSLYMGLEISTTTWDEFGFMVRDNTTADQSEPGPITDRLDTDSDGETDTVRLTWYAEYDEYIARIYRRIGDGVQFVRTETSSVQRIEISGVLGDLEISTSTSTAGSAESYRIINVTLNGYVDLEVVVSDDGDPVDHGIEVRLVSEKGTMSVANTSAPFHAQVEIPSFADIGELLTVQVVDTDSGKVLGESRTSVHEESWSVQVEVHEANARAPSIGFLLLALLPGILILAYAFVLSRGPRRSGQ